MSEIEHTSSLTDAMDQLEGLITHLEEGAFARQRLIDLVRASEAKFRLLKTQIPAMIWTMDVEMRFTGIFGARVSYSDPPQAELLGQSIFEYFQTENPESLCATVSELMNRGETAVYELRRKQRVFQVHIGPLRERGTQILGGVGVAVEITDRKDAEAAVLASEQRYRELFETSNEFIFSFDLDGNFIAANGAAHRVTGYDIGELKQLNLVQMVAPEYRDAVRLVIGSLLGGQPAHATEFEVVTKDGRRVWLEVTPRLQFTNGHPTGFQGVSREITERKRAELLERDRGQILALIAKNETLDTILSGINRLVERHALQSICSIWRVAEGRLNHAGESRLPESFVRGFDGLQISSTGWPGARTASLGKFLTAEDASTDILWEDYREPALSNHLLASCFTPIMTQSGGVSGILAVFYKEPHSPDRYELEIFEAANWLAAAALEHQKLIDKLSEPPVQQTEGQPAAEGQAEIRVEVAPLTLAVAVGNKLLSDQVEASLRGMPVQVVLASTDLSDWPGFLERLERLGPDVLLADISLFRDGVEQAVHAIRSSPAAPAVVVLHTVADRDLILTVVRAGAREYLYPPINVHLRNALQRILRDRETKTAPGHAAGKVLGFFSVKGGCGATTIACHVARELQRITTQNVLLADFDVSAGMIRHLMKATSKYSVLDAASNTYRLDSSMWKTLVSNGTPGLEVIASSAAPTLKSLPRDSNFRHILRFARNRYDWVLVDLGRGLNSRTMAALEEVDEVFVVTTPDVPALMQAKLVVQSLSDEGFGLNCLHLVLNRDWKGSLSPEELEKALGLPVYDSIPFDGDDLDESYTKGELVAPTTSLGKHYARLATKVTGGPPPEKPKGFLPSLRVKLNL